MEYEEEDVFTGEFGIASADRAITSRLLVRYPRRLPPILQKICNALDKVTGTRLRIARAALQSPPIRQILILGVIVPSRTELMASVLEQLSTTRHRVTISTIDVGDRGKFDNLNILLKRHNLSQFDWVILTDDDIAVPADFLNQFIYVLEHLHIDVGQPAHDFNSYLTWSLTRRHFGLIARQTKFVEIGPLVALHRRAFEYVLPFPDVGMGWGLDFHWSFIAQKHSLTMGIVDALPICHLRPVGKTYDQGSARSRGNAFLRAYGGSGRKVALQTVRRFFTLP